MPKVTAVSKRNPSFPPGRLLNQAVSGSNKSLTRPIARKTPIISRPAGPTSCPPIRMKRSSNKKEMMISPETTKLSAATLRTVAVDSWTSRKCTSTMRSLWMATYQVISKTRERRRISSRIKINWRRIKASRGISRLWRS